MSEPWVTGSIDISRLATGIYIMRVATDNGVTFEEKVVRE
ncbi:MAG: T9SS type A sorting domain-containing protein [Bacteroidales bacterium]|nr:T9SS type A sorting domain-containing protein [Bacteroidales bacterium]